MVLETIDPYQDAERAHAVNTLDKVTVDLTHKDSREDPSLAAHESRDGGESLRSYAKDLRGSLSDPSREAPAEGTDAAGGEGRDAVPEEVPAGIFNVGSEQQDLEASPSIMSTPSLMDTLQETAGSWIDAVCGTPFVAEAPPATTDAGDVDPAAATATLLGASPTNQAVARAPSDDDAAAYVPPVLAAAQPAHPPPVTMEGVTRSSGSFHSVVKSASSATEVKLEAAEEDAEEEGDAAAAADAVGADEPKADAESPEDANTEPVADPEGERLYCPAAPSEEDAEDAAAGDEAEDAPAHDATPKKKRMSFLRKSNLTDLAQAAKKEEKEKEAAKAEDAKASEAEEEEEQAPAEATPTPKKTRMPSMRSASRSKREAKPAVGETGLAAYNTAMAKKRAELGLPPPDKTAEPATEMAGAAPSKEPTPRKTKKSSLRSVSRSKREAKPADQETGLAAYNTAMAKKRAELGLPPPDKTAEPATEMAGAAPSKKEPTPRKTKKSSLRSVSRSKKDRPPVQETGLAGYNKAMAKKRTELGLAATVTEIRSLVKETQCPRSAEYLLEKYEGREAELLQNLKKKSAKNTAASNLPPPEMDLE